MNRREMILTALGIATGGDVLAKLAHYEEVPPQNPRWERKDTKLDDGIRFLVLEQPITFTLDDKIIEEKPYWSRVSILYTHILRGSILPGAVSKECRLHGHSLIEANQFTPIAGVVWVKTTEPFCLPSSLHNAPIAVVNNETATPKGIIVTSEELYSTIENRPDPNLITGSFRMIYDKEGDACFPYIVWSDIEDEALVLAKPRSHSDIVMQPSGLLRKYTLEA
jgi:hypothetical protein